MGANILSILAILYMHKLESTTILGHHLIGLYARYVDDILILTIDRFTAENILEIMNNANEHINFTLELPNNNKELALLDFKLHIDDNGTAHFEFYTKTAKKKLFIHAKSALPTRLKQNVILEERKRIANRCSDNTKHKKHLANFNDTLKLNGYSHSQISANNLKRKRKHNSNNQTYHYLKLPYINEITNNKINRIYKSLGLPVRMYHKKLTLENMLKPNNEQMNLSCQKNTCIIKQDQICLKKNIVYKLECKICKEIYIGSTIRSFHERFHEHLKTTGKPINNHLHFCNNTNSIPFNISFLAKDHDALNLRMREAYYINKFNPKLNSKNEMENLMNFISTFKHH